jgi:hypothetical protein
MAADTPQLGVQGEHQMGNCHQWVWLSVILIAGCGFGPPRPYWKVDSSYDSKLVTVYLEDGTEKSATIQRPAKDSTGRITVEKSGLLVDYGILSGEFRVFGVRLSGSNQRIPSYQEAVKQQAK